MALKDQPYIPIYVQDVLTDEKLIECSAASQGVYFRLLCVLHKQPTYGMFLLKAKHKQNKEQILNFAFALVRSLALDAKTIQKGLQELIDEEVLHLDGDYIIQKRMVKDGEISQKRSIAGQKGKGTSTKQNGKPGFIYLISDKKISHHVGATKSLKNKVYRLRSDNKLGKDFELQHFAEVADMGDYLSAIKSQFSEMYNEGWVEGNYQDIELMFTSFVQNKLLAKTKTKNKQNPEDEIEDEYEIETEIETKKGNALQNDLPPFGHSGIEQFQCDAISYLEKELSYVKSYRDTFTLKEIYLKISKVLKLKGLGSDGASVTKEFIAMVVGASEFHLKNFDLNYMNNNFNKFVAKQAVPTINPGDYSKSDFKTNLADEYKQ